jgi:hypothetical protein
LFIETATRRFFVCKFRLSIAEPKEGEYGNILIIFSWLPFSC